MRHQTLFIATLILALVATGCKKKQEEEITKNTDITLYSGDQVKIELSSTTPAQWTTSNDFVAKIVNDSVKAMHLGTCKLLADNGNTADVTVMPRYRFFQEPITAWNMDTTTLLDSMTLTPVRQFCLDSAGVRTMLGFLRLPQVEATLYYFEDNQLKLTWSLIPKKDSILSHMEDFLLERYEYMESVIETTLWSDATVHKYMNAYSPKNANIIVGYHDMILDESAFMIEQMFGTNVLLGLIYQDASIQKFDTAWVESYVNNLPSRLMNK